MILVSLGILGASPSLGAVPFAARGSAQLGAARQVLLGMVGWSWCLHGEEPLPLESSDTNAESISLLAASSHTGCGGSRALGKRLGVCGSR